MEQVTLKPTTRGRFSRTLTTAVLLCFALLLGVTIVLSTSSSLTGFAQNLPRPQQVLGDTTEDSRCEGRAYQKPKAIALQTVEVGLHYSEDSLQIYTVYGSSVAGLRSAISNCEVRKQSGDHHALTTYTINWQYDTQVSAGMCAITNVKVGLATNQYLPRLAENQVLTTDDRATWDAYYASLVRHENEHLALNKKYAADLHAALVSLSGPCSGIETSTTTVINAYLQLLNSANNMLDSQTNHGADTGAVL